MADARPDGGGEPCGDIGFAISNIDCANIPAPVGDFRPGQTVTIFTDSVASCPQGLSCDVIAQHDGTMVMVASAEKVEIKQTGRVVVEGERPLVLVAHDEVLVNGVLLVNPRPITDASFCAEGRGQSANPTLYEQGPGGGGGGFGTAGGNGGSDSQTGSLAGGASNGAGSLVPLRGGCPGGGGGGAEDGGSEGAGGDGGGGGGALQIAAPRITVEGEIYAPGGGGLGAQSGPNGPGCGDAGGGGGGSGGALLLEANTVQLRTESIVAAGGGGGGAGCNTGDEKPNRDGDLGLTDGAEGAGGTVFDNAGEGGDGAGSNGPAQHGDGSEFAGSGGGGGGFGRIRINAASATLDGTIIGPHTQAAPAIR